MRIAITTDGDFVSAHFGQCPAFTIIDIEDNKVKNKQLVPNNAEHGGGGCIAVDEILKHKIQHVISGGMGMGAKQKFAAANVNVTGFTGTVDDAIKAFLTNSTSELSSCKEHGDCH
ncbi:MAG: NifB/NifX family molybdenum-iron cluster-binding protein [Candidatus Margulisbacteria bacterium]|nr:NifB/NifX family molybdenum-iron cluster-binding protein [Candidatus Margulisiibacteriota bacterium]